MKRSFFSFFSFFSFLLIKLGGSIFIALFFWTCTPDPEPLPRENVVQDTQSQTVAQTIGYTQNNKAICQASMKMGHEASECTGCVMINGVLTHVPCRGPGNACTVNTAFLIEVGESHPSFVPGDPYSYYIVTSLPPALLDSLNISDELADNDFMLFPGRSFWVSGSWVNWRYRWMNIPEQYIKRDTEDDLFYYERVSFTATPLFDNEEEE
jgi:hypothetical protein